MSENAKAKARRPWLRGILVLWVALLAASHISWSREDPTARLAAGDSSVRLLAVDGDTRGPEQVLACYTIMGAAPEAARATLVLIHGSPGSMQDFDALAALLPQDLRVLVPDLPGFGCSGRSLPDYSARAHGVYLLQLLDELEIEKAHLVAFSMGGAVAMELASLAPERVASVALVAALGVEELELFGDHELNHLVHIFQLRLIQLARWGLPHFGGADEWILGLSYGRNFTDTDQRRIRPILETLAAPTLIVHGQRDFLVPLAAARETWRIVPQAELVELDASHFVLWNHTEQVADLLGDFVAKAEAGAMPLRSEASGERLAAAARPFDPASIPPASGLTLLLLVLLLVVGTWVSEDLTVIAAGLMVAQGRLAIGPALCGCTAGILIGDVGLFLAGRVFGRALVARAPLRWFLTVEALDRASAWFQRLGPRAVFLSRLMPGLRLPTYFAAGVLRTSLLKFLFYFTLAVLFWTPLLLGFAVLFGDQARELIEAWGLPALVLLVLVLLLFERVGLRLFTFRGRRSLVGTWRRWTQWEFWPPFAFYPPIVAYILMLGLFYRSLRVLTAVNPGIPSGGLIGEHKSKILAGIDNSNGFVAEFRLLRAHADEHQRVVEAMSAAEALGGFPIVFKPEVGQRGSGVVVVKTSDELTELVSAMAVDHILQEFVAGPEYGIFYIRQSGASRGSLFSITEKIIPQLVGDGEHTLEELILLGKRSVVMAPQYMRRHLAQLDEVPKHGERIQLVDIGTHCRGAIFKNGQRLATPALAARIDKLSRSFNGFYFGRFDVRAKSEEALLAGRDFKVLELNGLTSEAAHIYDPETSIFEAWRVLGRQWRLAFEIGAANHAAGAELSSWSSILREVFGYSAKQRSHNI